MNCPQCGLDLDQMTSTSCPRCGHVLGADPRNQPNQPTQSEQLADEETHHLPAQQRTPAAASEQLAQPNAPVAGQPNLQAFAPSFGQVPSAQPPDLQLPDIDMLQPFDVSAWPQASEMPPAAPAPGYPAASSGPLYSQPAVSGGPLYGHPAVSGGPAYGYPAISGGPQYGQPAISGGPLYGQPAVPSGPLAGQGYPTVSGGPLYGQQSVGPAMPVYGQPATASSPMFGQYAPVSAPLSRRRRLPILIGIVVVVVLVLGGAGAAFAAFSSRNSTVLFQDALTSDSGHWPSTASCTFQSDGYHIVDGHICYADTADFGTANISVQLQQVSGTAANAYSGVALRRVSQGNLYTFGITTGGQWAFVKTVDDQQTALGGGPQSSSAIHKGLGSSNTLEVRARGSHFDLFVNGAQVGAVDDSTFSAGRCGLFADQGIETTFTSFQVSK